MSTPQSNSDANLPDPAIGAGPGRTQCTCSAMGEGMPRYLFLGIFMVYALQLHIAATTALHWKHTPVVDVSVYSKVAEINVSTVQARFVPMFGAPGDIDSLRDDGSTTRLCLESCSGSGIVSQNSVFRGFFNVAIKLPCGVGGDSAGIILAFYVQGGGNIDNALTAAARLGLECRIYTKVANDERIRHGHDYFGVTRMLDPKVVLVAYR